MQAEDRSRYPHPFGMFKSVVKLAKNGEEKIRSAFLPFTSGVHLCTVKFADREHGSFCYELEGLALPPAVGAEHEFTMDLHRPTTVYVPVGTNNPQLDSARKVFMEGHPLAKVKEQVQLLKAQKTSAYLPQFHAHCQHVATSNVRCMQGSASITLFLMRAASSSARTRLQ